MARTKITYQLNTRRLQKEFDATAEEIDRGIGDFIDAIAEKSQDRVPVDKGTVKKSMEVVHEKNHHAIIYHSPVAAYLEFGTGLFGPKKSLIYPKKSKVLAWVESGARPVTSSGWKAAQKQGRARYAKSIKGMRPQPFLRPSFDETRGSLGKFIRRAIKSN